MGIFPTRRVRSGHCGRRRESEDLATQGIPSAVPTELFGEGSRYEKIGDMKAPLFVRALTKSEHTGLRTGLRSAHAFTLRRSQLLLLSTEGRTPRQIARHLGCTDQTVRNVIRSFETEDRACLEQKSSRPKTAKPELDEAKCEQVRALLHQSPRHFGKARSTWSLSLVAEVCRERG
jgi:transposase